MATGQLIGVLHNLRRAALRHDGAGLTDAELLEAFLARRDEAAFEALVRRHGPMVLGVCQRVLRNHADAEDAFQATFLVLVRKAASVVPRSQVGNWLYGVACNTARKARAMSGKRRAKEREAGMRPRLPTFEETGRRLQEALDEELSRLPDKYRVPIVLCELEGRPLKEAARQLGWPQGTVASRLVRGRALLGKRLARHVAVSSGLALAVCSGLASAALPPALVETTVRVAAHLSAGGAAARLVPAKVAALTERVLKSMLLTKLKLTAGIVLLVLLGVGAFTVQTWASDEKANEQPATRKADPPAAKPAAKEGRIYVYVGLGMAALQPDGKKSSELGAHSDEDKKNLLPSRTRLSPDGKRLVFAKSMPKPGTDDVYAAPDRLYLRDVNKTGAGEELVAMPDVELHFWFWSPDGTKIAFTSWDEEHFTRNWIVDVKSKKVEEVKMPAIKFGGRDSQATIEGWSPDGKWFLANGDGLHLVKTDGSDSRLLTNEAPQGILGRFRFSPDGKKVLIVGLNDDQSMQLYVADVATGKTQAVVEAKDLGELYACWSPDGRRIAYCATLLDKDGTQTSLYLTDPDGKNTTTLRTEKHEPYRVKLRLLDWR
jgi:RNA polymerase sigma factor (sigma-70 family)